MRVLVLFLLLATASTPAVYVAPNGDDRGPGSAERPFRTLARARDYARSLGPGTSVLLRAGTYELRETLELTEQDNGITIAAAPGEIVRIMGGRVVPASAWRPVRDATNVARLPEAARSRVRALRLTELGILDPGTLRSRGFSRPVKPAHLELFFGRKRMTIARWPNREFTTIAAPGDPSPGDDQHGGSLGRLEHGFRYEGDRPRQWKDFENVWVHGYWAWDWANSYEHVESLDPDTRLVRTAPPYGLYGFRKGQRFYFLNVLEELDEPGEYYLDTKERVLYFWPPGDPATHEASVSLLELPLIRLREASAITLRGLTLESTRGVGIEVVGGEGITIRECTVRNTGNLGIVVRNGRKHRIESCEIYQTGDGAIDLAGGDRKTLTPAGHSATNNHLHHYAEWSRTYQPGIHVSGVGNAVGHNHIHDAPHNGILLHGNDHVIEYNEIHHVCLETGDVGAFYMGRDWTERGNVIRYNYFHHTGGVGMGSMGVYLDDCASGSTVSGNIFFKVQRAVFIGGGRDHLVENNVFIECDPAVRVDGRGVDPRPVWHNMVYKTMKERLEAVDQQLYRRRYPELDTLDPYYRGAEGVPPGNIRVRNNVVVGNPSLVREWLKIQWRADPRNVESTGNTVIGQTVPYGAIGQPSGRR